MATAHKVLDIARKQIGKTEAPPSSNNCLFSRWYPMPGSPWCAMFVSWVLDKAGISGYKHAYTPTGADLFRREDRWFTARPEPGDVVYFDFPDSLDRIQHVGFVEKVNADGTVATIEGNTSAGDAGSQDNGGGVFRRVRTRSLIVGFGRPPYEGGRKPDKPEKDFAKKAWFGRGDSGGDVRTWQRQLNTVLDLSLEVDGTFGSKVLAATKAFQKDCGIEDDGKVGTVTLARMEKMFREAKSERADKPPTLELYDSGAWVKKAQKLLADVGFDLSPHGADGDFGEVTALAVETFKEKHGLPTTAVMGPRAWAELLHP